MDSEPADANRIQELPFNESLPTSTLPESGESADEDLTIERNTSNLIIGITNVFNSGKSYNEIIMSVLAMIGDILHPDRILVFERGSETTSCTFEWCAEHVPPQIHLITSMANAHFDTMSEIAENEVPPDSEMQVLATGIDEIGEFDEVLAKRLSKRGVARMMAVPLMSDGEFIGYLSANNYRLKKGVDAKRVLDTVAPFITTRIVNQRLMNQLELTGTHDSLTGLLNRRGIDAAIAEHLAENQSDSYALALMDIDDFKIVNDLYGHDVGDAALKTLARVVTGAFPPGAIIGRNGGDEFLAMLFGKDIEKIDELVDTFSSASFECELNGKKYPLSMSVGFAEYPAQAISLQDAYTKADAALYSVKLAGKGGCKRYKPEYESQYRSQLGFTPRDIGENIPCAIAVCKATEVGEILYGNDELVKMFECESFADFMEHTGGIFEGIVHPDDRAEVKRELERQVNDAELVGKAYVDYRIRTKTGSIKHIADSSRRVHFANVGEVAYILLVDKGERARFMQIPPEETTR